MMKLLWLHNGAKEKEKKKTFFSLKMLPWFQKNKRFGGVIYVAYHSTSNKDKYSMPTVI